MQLVYDRKERRWLPFEEKAKAAPAEAKPARKKAAAPANKSRKTANK